jgi:hypothetical protein
MRSRNQRGRCTRNSAQPDRYAAEEVSSGATAIRFPMRLRRPVGKHWSIVTPVKESDLTEEEKRIAGENKDVRIP